MKKTYIYFLVISLLTGSISFAQTVPPIEWGNVNNTYGDGDSVMIHTKKIPGQDSFVGVGVYNNNGLNIIVIDTIGTILATSPQLQYSNSFTTADISPTADQGFILSGWGQFVSDNFPTLTGFGGIDAILIKYDSELEIEWVQNYGGSGEERTFNVIQTSDGGYLFGGRTNSEDGQLTGIKNYGTTINYYIVKTDSLGSVQWTKTYGGNPTNSGYNRFYQVKEIIELTDGNYIVAGTNASADGDVLNPWGGSDIWVLKLDTTGTVLWQKNLGGSNYDLMDGGLLQLADGDIALSGLTNSGDGDVENFMGGNGDGWVIKLNSETGALIWEKTIGGTAYESVPNNAQANDNIKILPDGNIISTFNTRSPDIPGYISGNVALLTKINSNTGEIMWQKIYGAETNSSTARFLFPYPDGSILVHAITAANPTGSDFDSGFTTIDPDGTKWFFKLAPCPLFTLNEDVTVCEGTAYEFYDQTITEAGTYTHTIEGESCDEIVTLVVNTIESAETPVITEAGGVLSTAEGYTTYQWYKDNEEIEEATSNTYTPAESGAYTVEVTNENDCAKISEVYNYTYLSVNESKWFSDMKLYPNPADNVLYIKIPRFNGKADIQLYSIDGRQVWGGQLNNGQLSTSQLSKGTYLIKIITEEGTAVRKIIKE